MFGWGQDIGVDLGTANTLVFIRGKGIVLREPSVVARDSQTGKVFAYGAEARRMLGRTPGNIIAMRPLRDGVIADFDATESMLRYFLSRVSGRFNLIRPRVMVCVPTGVTSVEKRAVLEAAMVAGARKTYLIEEPTAAALGAGIDIGLPNGSMVIDIGGGTTDIAVLSMGGVVTSASVRAGGDRFDEALIRYLKKKHNLAIGERTAEEIKVTIGNAFPHKGKEKEMEVRGRDLLSGLPRTVGLTSTETAEAMKEVTDQIVEALRGVLERTPPELASDILERGIVMTGGGGLLAGLDQLLTHETQVPVILAENALSCVVTGTGKALECLDELEAHLITTGRP